MRLPVALANLFNRAGRPVTNVRRFDGAAGGRRGNGMGGFGRINGEVGASAPTLRSRARYLASNNPWVAQAVANWVGALVGPGIQPVCRHPDATTRTLLGSHFDTWAESADLEERFDFAGLQTEIARALVIDGEAFVQVLDTDDGVRLRHLPSDLVDSSLSRDLGDGGVIVQGVELDPAGRRVAYHILRERPGEFAGNYSAPVRVPAEDILHIMKPLAPGQIRGVSWLAPIVLPASDLDQLLDALLTGAKIAALHAGFLIDQNGGGEPFDGDLENVSLEPGTVRRLPAGWDIKFSSPEQAKEVAPFLRLNLQQLAAGLGLPTHLVDGDLSGANYSSLRAGLLPFRQRVEQIQWGVLAPQFLRPVWRRVVTTGILSGEIDAPGFEDAPRPYLAVDWLPPKPMQVDPAKDTEASVAEINAGLTTRRKAVAERGWDVDELDAEIAADRDREARLGLVFGDRPATTATANPKDPADGDE